MDSVGWSGSQVALQINSSLILVTALFQGDGLAVDLMFLIECSPNGSNGAVGRG